MDEKNNWTDGLSFGYGVTHREINEVLDNFVKEIYKGALEGFDMKRKIKLGDEFIILSGYDTERDEKKAEKDIKRALSYISTFSLQDIMSLLAPYRKRMAKQSQEEFEEWSEMADDEE